MIVSKSRDAVIAAVASLAPESVEISARGDCGWHIVFRPARFERLSLSNSGRGRSSTENSPAELAEKLVSDVSGLLGQSGTPWPEMATSSVASEVSASDDGLQIVVKDEAGHQASSTLVSLWTAQQREQRARARVELEQLAQLDAPAPGRYLSMQLTRLLLAEDGRLEPDVQAEAAIRVAAFCDLAFLNRFQLVDGAWEIDPEPTEMAHLDRLLDAVADGEDRDLDDWIGSGPSLLALTSEQLITAGIWSRLPRRVPRAASVFVSADDRDNAGIDAVKLVLSGIPNTAHAAHPPELVALAQCAVIARTIDNRNLAGSDLVDAAGPAADVLTAGFDWAARHQQQASAGRTRPIGDAGTMPGYWGQ